MPLSSQSKTERIDLRTSLAAKALLADRCVFKLDDKAWKEFQIMLDRPVSPNPRLKKLLAGAE